MATHSSILAWGIPWTEEPGGLQSMGHKELDAIERLSTASVYMRGRLTKHNNFMMTILHLGISDVLLTSQALSHPLLNLRLKKNSRED